MNIMLTLGAAARHCGVPKGTIGKAIASGKLSATRREDGSWAIDGAELARYIEVNGCRFRTDAVKKRIETNFGEQLTTVAELRVCAAQAEQRLADLKAVLGDMRRLRDDIAQQRDKWETAAQRLAEPAPEPAATPAAPVPWWRWLRTSRPA
jgi:hypothetical protein